MKEPAWLKSVLDECAACSLDSPADREKLASAIVAKLEELTKPMAACIASAAHYAITARGIKDGAGDIARAVGGDAVMSILILLGRAE